MAFTINVISTTNIVGPATGDTNVRSKRVAATVVIDAGTAYTRGGFAVNASQLGLSQLRFLRVEPTARYVLLFDFVDTGIVYLTRPESSAPTRILAATTSALDVKPSGQLNPAYPVAPRDATAGHVRITTGGAEVENGAVLPAISTTATAEGI
jgi:hypothetical protein